MGTFRFILRADKTDKKGKAPIELNYSLHGQRKKVVTDTKIFPVNWDVENYAVVYLDKKAAKKLLPGVEPDQLLTAQEINTINSDLLGMIEDIKKIERRYEDDKIVYSSQMVMDEYKRRKDTTTKKDAPTNALFDFMERYIQDNAVTREKASLSVYKSAKRQLQEFQKTKKQVITFDTIDYAFFQSFQSFLIEVQKLNNTTVAKQLSTVKTFLNYARKYGYEVSDKYRDFKIKRESLEVIALTKEEFEKLFYLDLAGNKKLEQVRDAFCFSCATGLRYSDLYQLRKEHIKQDEIVLSIKKTKEILSVPLNGYSRFILSKYADRHKPLQVISNQKMNDYLKDLCKLAEIDAPTEIVRFRGSERQVNVYPKHELITVHVGRKTFVTLSLEKGMSAEEVMSITGHKDYKSFKRYVKITEQRKKVVMLNAWGDVQKPTSKIISIAS